MTQWTLLLLAGSSILGCQKTSEKESVTVDKPNVIYILVDDLGFGDLTTFTPSQQTLTTPNISKLASEGMKFTNHYAGNSVCGPSRATLLTGKHNGHNSVRGNHPDQVQLLGDDELTVAKVFQKAGYVTGNIGKWGVGHPPPVDDPKRKGFDYFYGYINMWHAHNAFPEFLYRNGEKEAIPENKLQLVDGKNPWAHKPEGCGVAGVAVKHSHKLFEADALKFISDNKKNPFFLYLALTAPHANNEKFPDGMEVESWGEYADKDWPDPEKGFAQNVRYIDNTIGSVMSHLKKEGIADNTLVIFASDNGPHGEGGHRVGFFDSNGELRGQKRDMYEGGVRIPMIAHWPNKVQAGTSTSLTSGFLDVLPTVCEITSQDVPSDVDGISFLPTLLGNSESQKKHNYLYWEFYEQGGKQAILKDNWKAVKLNVRDSKKPVKFELYNLNEDLSEKNDVAALYPEKVEMFEKLFQEAHVPFSVTSLFSDEENVEVAF
ncbi:arylsulfatase A-like enzyme [Sediminitomix flava]|uniref:Arylsulfatase A-like enzyme n=2 Tax=Sediminitomix flava TaxID=379075 RepID=A0A315Z6S9_SEDFL|nr:arylsulfatase A-like enzyme [Sediminitomix flava]